MDIGTAEIIDEIDEPRRVRSGRSAGSGPSNGGRKDPGDGGDGPQPDEETDPPRFVPGKSRIFTGFLLLVVLMTFGGLIAAYVVIATNGVAEWKPFALPVQVWISTVIILISSISYHLAKSSLDRNDQPATKRWLIVTTALGATFISSQILVWIALNSRGFYLRGNPYAGFFYVLTAVHAVHVLGGITALGSILLRSWYPAINADEIERRRTVGQVVGWYWHFMGALWVVLFVLLGFWK